jgi:hypothetical protein
MFYYIDVHLLAHYIQLMEVIFAPETNWKNDARIVLLVSLAELTYCEQSSI